MARIIAVALSKGGTGKTTTAVNLADGLARSGQRVLLVDCDSQGQATYMLGVAPSAGLAELVAGEADAYECTIKAREGLHVIGGGRALAGIKKMIDRRDVGSERILAEALEPLADGYDVILLDCAPGWDAVLANALFAADEVLSPVACEALALQGLGEFVKSLAGVQRYRRHLRLRYIVPTFADGRVKKTRETIDQLREHFARELCAPIRASVKLSQAAGHQQTIFEYAPDSVGAVDYAKLTERVAANGKA